MLFAPNEPQVMLYNKNISFPKINIYNFMIVPFTWWVWCFFALKPLINLTKGVPNKFHLGKTTTKSYQANVTHKPIPKVYIDIEQKYSMKTLM